jgi:gliding motility-associated-like protein
MRVTKLFFIFLIFFYYQKGSAQYISVDETYTPQQLVEDILINSQCVVVSNVAVSGGNFATGENSWGFFSGSGTTFPFQNGVILATGKINNAPGPNAYLSDDGGNMGWDGDTDLNQALGLSNSFNATVLEFDFVPLGNTISFDFIFSSEQYLLNPNPNQCDFTDGFAFLLKEVGSSTYENLAVVPNTSIPIRVNTVRGRGTICPAANQQYFDAFNEFEHPTNYNGQTKVLTARGNVIPGNTYHIKLVIADEGNHRYDSAIFLGGGSFNLGVDLGEDRTFLRDNPVCATENIVLNATTQGATNYIWKLNGAVLPGQNSNTLNINSPHDPVNESGVYEVEVYVSGILCGNDTIEIEFAPEITVDQTSFVQCDNDGAQDGVRSFELYNLVDDIFPNLPSDFDVSFYFDPSDTSPLPNFYQNSVPYTQTIYAKFNKYQNCYAAIPITLNVNTFEDNILNEIIGYCAGNSVELEADSGYPFYQWETGENSQSIIVNTPGNYIVTIGNSLNCTKQKIFTVVPSEIATIENIEISDFSESNSALIEVIGSGDYEYSLDGINYQDEPLFSNLEPGEYTLFVNDKNGCGTQIDSFYILGYPNFFTPNGDGFNDVWQIKNLDKRGFENAKITIFDRYGNLIKQINNPNDFWDGTLRGNNLLSQDYWFVLALPNGKTIRGHFSLIR